MNKQKQKHFFLLLLLPCLCIFLCACGKNDGYSYMEEEIIAFVQEHEEEIRQQIEEAGDEKIKEFDGVIDVADRREFRGLVYYEYAYTGIMTSTLCAGFYYSIEDEPSLYGGASWSGGDGWSEVPTEKENHWRYVEDGGDNYCVSKKICDNFYYVLSGN